MKPIHDLIEPTITAMGLVLWACELHQHGNQAVLRVYLDRDQGEGVTLDECALASREIGAILDVEDPIKNRYQLEVSSPGLNRVLSRPSHFEKYVGRAVKMKLRVAVANKKNIVARIEKVIGDTIYFVVDDQKISMKLGEIQRANLVIEG